MESAWPRTQARPSRAQRSASQVPGEEAFDAADEILPVGGDGLQKWGGCRLQMPVRKDRTILVQDAEIQAAGVESDATITLVWRGVESPEVASAFFDCLTQRQQSHGGMPRRGPQ
jgi:hypothetical protein